MIILSYLPRVLIHFLRTLLAHFRSVQFLGRNIPWTSEIRGHQNISIGNSFSMGPYCEITCESPRNSPAGRIEIGDFVNLNRSVIINADIGGKIFLGKNVLIGPGSILRATNHRFDDLTKSIREQGHVAGQITLEDDVWLGAGVIVVPNVTIGRGSIVGAGSVVTKDIPPGVVAAGVPAKIIRERSTRV